MPGKDAPRRFLIAGNWKMNGLRADALRWARATRDAAAGAPNDVAVFPPYPWIAEVARALEGSGVAVGGQACHPEPFGAFTAGVSAAMLRDAGCTLVLCGHSERRRAGETDAQVAAQVRQALDAGLAPVLCVGETAEERRAHRTRDVLLRQLAEPLATLRAREEPLTIAYEPVWAIGTGATATPETAAEAHGWIRAGVALDHPVRASSTLRILYGGSVTPANIGGLLAAKDVDGVLVGGASLDTAAFGRIVRAVPATPDRPGP
jgi:triosephosphate isomerase